MLQEDDVIGVYADWLRGQGALLLAEGANQMRAFRFQIPDARRKAPDLVAYRSEELLICEAKVRVPNLFSNSGSVVSDFEALSFLKRTPFLIEKLKQEARERLAACGAEVPIKLEVSYGLIAQGSFEKHRTRPGIDDFILVSVDAHKGRFKYESDAWRPIAFPE